MDDDRAEIEDDPAGTEHPLPAITLDLGFTQNMVDLVADGAELGFAFSAANDQVINQVGGLADIKRLEVDGQFAFGRFGDQLDEFFVAFSGNDYSLSFLR